MINAEERSCTTRFELGQMFRKEDEARDFNQAANWFQRSAQQGYRRAQYHIGVMYARGFGVSRDHARAYAWLKIAACQGSPRARRYLERVTTRVPHEQHLEAQLLARSYYQHYVVPFA
jgi:hypothetical protein